MHCKVNVNYIDYRSCNPLFDVLTPAVVQPEERREKREKRDFDNP